MEKNLEVGVRELKNKLSAYLKMVKEGRPLAITERGKTVAYITPANKARQYEGLFDLLKKGQAGWAGGKPHGADERVSVRGKPVSRIVIEERR